MSHDFEDVFANLYKMMHQPDIKKSADISGQKRKASRGEARRLNGIFEAGAAEHFTL